jgi:isopentenyl-diphosphate delta-isomerase
VDFKIADPAQEAMMEENCILVDPDDRVLGAASKRHCHLLDATGSSPLHRAFSVFAFNNAGQLLLQHRSEFKVTFPLLWANTCYSHPLHFEAEMDGEFGARLAAQRRLGLKLGVEPNVADPAKMTFHTRVHYQAPSPAVKPVWGEHEVDYILILQGLEETDVVPNTNEIADINWLLRENICSHFYLKTMVS